jgi:hypothetical protein
MSSKKHNMNKMLLHIVNIEKINQLNSEMKGIDKMLQRIINSEKLNEII